MKPPRTGVQAFAEVFGLSEGYARQALKRLPDSAKFEEQDAWLRAEAAIADRDAVATLDDSDIEDAAAADDPVAELTEIVGSRAERQLAARIGAHVSWARTVDRSARTAPARDAFEQKFLDEADGDPVRADHLRKAYFARLALKSAQARKRSKGR